jgi:hypothetical protein
MSDKIEIIEPTDAERGETPDTRVQIRNKGGRPRGRPPGKRTRHKRTAPDVKRAGVGSTEASAKTADPVRLDNDAAGQITRMSLEDRQITTFDLPMHRKKPGWDYKWEVITVMGQRVDRSILRDAHKAGWRPERAADWPELAEGLKPDDALEEGGQMLMGRPMHLSHEAQVETYNKAKTQERDRMQAASTGQSVGGQEGLSNVRGIQVRNASLNVELAVGGGPVGR